MTTDTSPEMDLVLKPTDVAETVMACVAARQPVCIWGEPGIGKSDVVGGVSDAMFASAYGYSIDGNRRVHDPAGAFVARNARPWLRDVRISLLDPVDLRGLPRVDGDGRAVWAIPGFLPLLGEVAGPGCFFLDEINRGQTMTQNGALQLVRDHQVGEARLDPSWVTVAAANPTGLGTGQLLEAMRGRFLHIEMVPDVGDWCQWANAAELDPHVIAFIRFRPALLAHSLRRPEETEAEHRERMNRSKHERALPTPRTWEYVARVIGQPVSSHVRHAMIAGAVGKAAATEFLSFLALYQNLPNIDGILLNPATAPIPDEASVLYAVSTALAARATVQNFGQVLEYADRLPVEFMILLVRDAVTRTPALQATADFTRWGTAHNDLL